MTLKETLAELKALGNEKMRKQNTKHGAVAKQFGVRRGEVRKVAKKIKTNHKLALALWKTENIDARFLAILVIEPTSLSAIVLDGLSSMTLTQRDLGQAVPRVGRFGKELRRKQ